MFNDYLAYLTNNIHDKNKRKPHEFFEKFGFGASQRENAQKAYREAVNYLGIHREGRIRKVAKQLQADMETMFESRSCHDYWNEVEIRMIEGSHKINMTRDAAVGMSLASESLNNSIKRKRKSKEDENKSHEANTDDILDHKDLVNEVERGEYNEGEDAFDADADTDTNANADDEALAHEVAEVILKSQLTLEDIWSKVMNELGKAKIRVQSIEARIIDLSGWKSVDWNGILHTSDHKIPHDVLKIIRSPPNELQCVDHLDEWKSSLLEIVNEEDAQLARKMISFYQKQLGQVVNLILTSTRERDIIVNVIVPLLGKTLQKFNVGQFKLDWIEKECTAVTLWKRKYINTDYTMLTNDYRKFDLIVGMRNYDIELLLLEVGTDQGGATRTKYRVDHTKLKVALKDCLDALVQQLHVPKAELHGISTLGLQIIGSTWIIYAMTYDHQSKFYFFNQLHSFSLPASFADLGDFLPRFIENMLALRHTMLSTIKKIKSIMKARATTPSPPLSPIHDTPDTPDTPAIKRMKENPFKEMFRNIY
ncbi:hypothetical protein G9A89_003788 [Geosiphon pyriformis]|nr:hypothetical protein G9A89_003788 [Geosiphon pyriformis]